MGSSSFLSSIASFRRSSRYPTSSYTRSWVDEAAAADHQQAQAYCSNNYELAAAHQPDTAHELHLQCRFHVELAEGLHHLQLAGGSCPPHLNWLVDAFAVTLSTHAGLQGTLIGINNSSSVNQSWCSVPSSSDRQAGSAGELGRRADEAVRMLDVCDALKRAMASVEAHLARLEGALESIEKALQTVASRQGFATQNTDCASLDNLQVKMSDGFPAAALHKATRRLSAALQDDQYVVSAKGSTFNRLLAEASASLVQLARRSGSLAKLKIRYSSSSRVAGGGTSETDCRPLALEATDGAMLTTLLVLAWSLSSLVSTTSAAQMSRSKRESPILTLSKLMGGAAGKVCKNNSGSGAPVWVAPLLQLQQDLAREERTSGGAAISRELQHLHTTAHSLLSGVLTSRSTFNMEIMRQDVKSLRKSLAEVQTSTSTIRCHTTSLFHHLLAFRLHSLP